MPASLKESLDRIEQWIRTYEAFDLAEKARFARESYLWTAEERIEWQETQADNGKVLRDLRMQADALRQKLTPS
ncbi:MULTISPECIES: hypothetical protein [Bradyrhizobium]|uniref:Uncharacterized protein n=1 Tax=Bradyrhizobium symbiodeficiens TaxID=1404367 RepID=A0A6G9AA77_9BRAD|nr:MULTISPECIES: hypothetical protein [Bradyrhizobium]QIP09377.1 hypothetical protein HAV00_25370 [Bradyrhizobium symbiodeficiens]UPJ55870.1 hypothetical protein IVB24_24880 [Bradyrhizobium sp. 192]